MRYPDEDSYTGDWLNDKFEGFGIYEFADKWLMKVSGAKT